jgi:hypothetical protein
MGPIHARPEHHNEALGAWRPERPCSPSSNLHRPLRSRAFQVAEANLLEFESADGWKPLCQFFGKEVPEGEYPRSNDAASTVKIHNFLYWLRIVKLSWKPLGAIVALGVALWLGYQRMEK